MTGALMDTRFSQLKEEKERFDQSCRSSIPKIQRVPKFLQQNERFYKYCSPKIVSFGPIHHNKDSLKEGEHYKRLWTSIFVAEYGEQNDQDVDQSYKILFKKIEDNIEELKNMFTEDAIEGYNDNDLAWILFVDGCSLIYFMENVDHQRPKALNLKYDRLMYIWRDALLLENQLPRKILEILCEEKGVDLNFIYSNYSNMGQSKRSGEVVIIVDNPKFFHILDFNRSFRLSSVIIQNIVGQNLMETREGEDDHDIMEENKTLNQKHSNEQLNWNTYKSIRDLKTVGIRVVANKTNNWRWSDISFKSKWFGGELRLPIFLFNDVTLYFFRNLIAYEMCPDVHYDYECCSFFSFMDSLIDNAEDVKELRSAGVFQNLLGSDEELAKLFNDLGDDLPTKMSSHFSPTNAVTYSKKYIMVKRQIETHYTNKWKTWLAQVYNTHFNTPWAMIAFLAASSALVLTFLQTWFTIRPN
ncbi:UPF0481 protein At3g47200-like [Vicia villosa]|uniref:UPF0481 protein At3g47200-like n=1 Tax=Vicia villosa TaxID=3911 RepID=UPI00273AC4C0|nr:UPF0481 protein At3g47200-like [Vicia villosa]